MRLAVLPFAVVLSLFGGILFSNASPPESVIPPKNTNNTFFLPKGMRLVWADEFDGPGVNLKNWSYETKDTGWNMYWNNEYQTYTDNGTNGPNAFISNGYLVIKAERADRFNGFDSYRSARLSTEKHHSWKYGVIAARIKMPYGNGLWPAFWMLGTNRNEDIWPECGEIDIAEMAGGENGRKFGAGDNIVSAALHGPEYSGDTARHTLYFPPDLGFNGRLSDGFHNYWVKWTPKEIVWYYETNPILKVTSSDVERWVFNHHFYIILNLAVGGNWPKYPDRTTVFPQYMVIDWVRVYQ